MYTPYNWQLYTEIVSEFKKEPELFEWLKYSSRVNDTKCPRELTNVESLLVKVYKSYPQFNLFNDISNRFVHVFNDMGVRIGYLDCHDSDMTEYRMYEPRTKYFFETYRNKITVHYQSQGKFYKLVDATFTDPLEAYNVLCKLDYGFDPIVTSGSY